MKRHRQKIQNKTLKRAVIDYQILVAKSTPLLVLVSMYLQYLAVDQFVRFTHNQSTLKKTIDRETTETERRSYCHSLCLVDSTYRRV